MVKSYPYVRYVPFLDGQVWVQSVCFDTGEYGMLFLAGCLIDSTATVTPRLCGQG